VPVGERLRSRLGAGWTVLLRELSAFGAVGAACFVLDLSLFQLLYATADLGAVTSKLISTVVATTVAFAGHRYWSFSHRVRRGLRREYALFFGVNGIALALGLLMIATVRYALGQESTLALQLTNVASIGLGTALRFDLYRRWVFLAPAGTPPPAAGSPAAESPRPANTPHELDPTAHPVA
jgi:putative flippase GtrA